jgi:hypothetical protein
MGMAGAYFHPTSEGALYDLATDSWRPTSLVGAPEARVPDGSPNGSGNVLGIGDKVFIWGGKRVNPPQTLPVTEGDAEAAALASAPGLICPTWRPEECVFGDGAIYDVVADTWTTASTAGAPSARFGHFMAWTGSDVVVWGGSVYEGAAPAQVDFVDGARFNPATNSWSPMAPFPAVACTDSSRQPLWVADRLVVIGSAARTQIGAVYDPASDTWADVSGIPGGLECDRAVVNNGRVIHSCGSHIGLFDPVGNTWQTLAALPDSPQDPLLFWTGSLVLQWGGWRPMPIAQPDAGCVPQPDAVCDPCTCERQPASEGAVFRPTASD